MLTTPCPDPSGGVLGLEGAGLGAATELSKGLFCTELRTGEGVADLWLAETGAAGAGSTSDRVSVSCQGAVRIAGTLSVREA